MANEAVELDGRLLVVAPLRLEVEHGVVARYGLADHRVGVLRVRDGDDAQSGGVREVGLRRLRVVLGSADAAAERHADRDGHAHGTLRSVMQLGHLGHDLVEGRVDESVELDLAHGPVTAIGEPDGRPEDAGFGEWRIDDSAGAELALQAVGHPVDTAQGADVLAEQHDPVVVVQGSAEACVDGVREGECLGVDRRIEHGHRTCPSPESPNMARYRA